MTKTTYIEPGDGVTTGQSGLVIRGILNDSFPAKEFYVPEDFIWTEISSPAFDNTVMVITYDHTISGTVTLPANCTLKFEGGRMLGTFTLVGNMSKIINVNIEQIFELTVTFTGSWLGTTLISPQWFGYTTDTVPTYIPNTYTVVYYPGTNAAPYIQKCLDSPFDVHMPNGYYYVTETIYHRSNKILNLGYAQMVALNNNGPHYFRNDHVRIYTDVNNLKMIVLCGYENDITVCPSIIGGILDCRSASAFTGALVYIDSDYQIGGGTLQLNLMGSKNSCKSGIGIGGWGLLWDTDKVPTYNLGCFHRYIIDIQASFFNKGIEIMSSRTGTSQWCTELTLNSKFILGCKIGAILNGMGDSSVYLVGQTDYVMFESEWEQPYFQFNLGNCIVDFFVWDLRSGGAFGGYYAPKIAASNTGFNTLFINKSIRQAPQFISSSLKKYPFIGSDGGGDFLSARFAPKTLLPTDNQMNNWTKRSTNTYTIAAYQGAGYDFDANLEPSTALPANTFVNLNDTVALFNNVGASFNFAPVSGYDLNVDFVEIVLNGYFRLNWLALFMLESDAAVRRIQFIKKVNIGDYYVHNVYPKSPGVNNQNVYKCPMDNRSYEQIIIRFIGCSDYGGQRIIDIGGYAQTKSIEPYLNSENGTLQAVPFKLAGMLVSQTGTNDPTLTFLGNNIGTITGTRYAQGVYRFISSDLFIVGKTIPNTNEEMTVDRITGNKFRIVQQDEDIIILTTTNSDDEPTDGLLDNRYVEIKVFK